MSGVAHLGFVYWGVFGQFNVLVLFGLFIRDWRCLCVFSFWICRRGMLCGFECIGAIWFTEYLGLYHLGCAVVIVSS